MKEDGFYRAGFEQGKKAGMRHMIEVLESKTTAVLQSGLFEYSQGQYWRGLNSALDYLKNEYEKETK